MSGAAVAKWGQTIAISWSNHLAYKLNFFLTIIGPSLIFFFIKVSLWDAIYSLSDNIVIQGYDFVEMLSYQAWVMLVVFLTQGHTSMKLSEDIRLGRISAYLVYPFTLWQFQFCSFLAFQGIQFLVTLFSLMFLLLMGLVATPEISTLLIGLAYCCLVGVFWFSVQYIIGLMSFWLEETWVLRVLLGIVATFLSGAIVPLEFFPEIMQNALRLTPFPYIAHVPVKLLQGHQLDSIGWSFLIMFFWVLLVSIISHIIWRRGVRLYAGAGM